MSGDKPGQVAEGAAVVEDRDERSYDRNAIGLSAMYLTIDGSTGSTVLESTKRVIGVAPAVFHSFSDLQPSFPLSAMVPTDNRSVQPGRGVDRTTRRPDR